MATYAAYRHIELDNVGYGKKRVLKPPGGGSSDIFGAGNDATSPRRINKANANASSLGAGFFGNGEQQQHHQQIPSSPSNGSSAPETPRSNKPDGNPVTGAGYDSSSQNGNASSASSDKSSTDSSPSVGSNSGMTRLKNRVPPGGFSSGLW